MCKACFTEYQIIVVIKSVEGKRIPRAVLAGMCYSCVIQLAV